MKLSLDLSSEDMKKTIEALFGSFTNLEHSSNNLMQTVKDDLSTLSSNLNSFFEVLREAKTGSDFLNGKMDALLINFDNFSMGIHSAVEQMGNLIVKFEGNAIAPLNELNNKLDSLTINLSNTFDNLFQVQANRRDTILENISSLNEVLAKNHAILNNPWEIIWVSWEPKSMKFWNIRISF
jgi:hypothetical protein